MKFEDKRKKNKNCELSHMVRPAESLEVYKQKQNILFIFECVEHKVQGELGKTVGVFERMHGRVPRAYARPGGPTRMACTSARHGRVCSLVVREARFGYSFVMHDSDGRAARLVVVHGLVGTCPRFGVATHGLVAHRLNFMGMIEPCG